MKLSANVYRRTSPNPHFIHKITLTDKDQNVLANAHLFTNLPSEKHPYGNTTLIEFSAETPSQAKQLHREIAFALNKLNFPLEHPITHSISRQKLQLLQGHFEGFEETPETPQRRLLITKLGEYKTKYPKGQGWKLPKLPPFRDLTHYTETLAQLASEIPDDREEQKLKGANAIKKRHENTHLDDPLFKALPQFTDPKTNVIQVAALVKHLNPHFSQLPTPDIQKTTEYQRAVYKITRWRKRALIPAKKLKEYPLSVEGREQHTAFVHWLLQNRLSRFIGAHTGITYENAVDIGLDAIDQTYSKYDPEKGTKYRTYLRKTIWGLLMHAAKKGSRLKTTSLDAEKYDDAPLYNFITAPEQEAPPEIAKAKLTAQIFEIAQRRKIKPIELLTWGLYHLKGRTQKRIGEHFQVSSQAIRLKINKAHTKITKELQQENES